MNIEKLSCTKQGAIPQCCSRIWEVTSSNPG